MLESSIDEAVATFNSLRTMEAEVKSAVDMMAGAISDGRKIMTCGNGGSAAEAAHFATELLCRFERDRPSLPAINMTADGSFLTATANDYEFIHVFSRQLEGLGRKGDVLVAFTTSGNSKNVVEALRVAHTRGMQTIGLLGRDGGAARAHCDVCLCVDSKSTARIQEAHQLLLHYLCQELELVMFPNLKSAK